MESENTGENRNPDGTFKPGISGNPLGKPRGAGISITTAIKRKLEEQYIDPNNPEAKRTYLEKVIDSIFHNALELKDARTLKDIWSYIDGLPKGTLALDVDKENLQQLTDFFRTVGKNESKT